MIQQKMRAAVIVEPGKVDIVSIPLPDPGPRQVRIRIEGCGVCASNLPPWEGRPWFTYPMEPGALGHESWGIVDALGPDVAGIAVGDRVASLGQNAFAEYAVSAQESVIPLPAALPPDMPFPGEPLGCAINVFRRSGIRAGDQVAIIGIGFLGTLLVQLSRAAGARVLAVSRRDSALDLACHFGAERALPLDDHWKIIEQVKEWTDGTLCPVVIEAVGKQWPLDLAAELTGERGRLVIAGYHQDSPRQVNMQLWNWRGLDVINAHEREASVYRDGVINAINAIQSGILNPFPLYTHSFGLEDLATALDLTAARPDGFMKALVRMPDAGRETVTRAA